MTHETIFYVNHKPRKRIIEDLGSGFIDRKVGSIPKDSSVWIKYVEDEGRQPYFILIPKGRETHMGVKDRRGFAFINELNMEGWEFLNERIKAKRKRKK
jgi:hypothetical protein